MASTELQHPSPHADAPIPSSASSPTSSPAPELGQPPFIATTPPGAERDVAVRFRAKLDRPGYAYLRPYATPVLAQLTAAKLPDERTRLVARLEAMFAVSHDPGGFGLTEVKQASNRYHGELGAAAIQRMRALPTTPDAMTARAEGEALARGVERETADLLEDDVHLTVALAPAEGTESEGHLDARVRIAPNMWEWLGPLVVYGAGMLSAGALAIYGLTPAPLELLPAVDAAPVRNRTALDRKGHARGAAQPVAVIQRAHVEFGNAAIDALGAAVAVAVAGADGYTVTPPGRDAFVVRLQACPLGSRVVRTMVNPSKTHVLQLSSEAADTEIARALASGLAEIAELVRIAEVGGDPDRSDLLGRSGVGATVLSPHDRGSVAELESLCRTLEASHGQPQRQPVYAQLHQLIDDLGLRATAVDQAARRAAIAGSLTPRAQQWLATLGRDPAALAGVTARAYVTANAQSEAAVAQDERDKAREAPLHQTPRQGAAITETGARNLARLAATRRAAKSEQMVLKYQGLAATAAPGYHRVESPQIGGGATLCAVRPGQLLIDDAGRWQRDLSENLAQTAAQLRWVREAGLGDPFEFVDDPNDRVPLDAVRYWQDTIAAQADVIDGRGATTVDPQGRLILRITPTLGAPLALEVGGNAVIGTGFPPENIPRPRAPTPAAAKVTLLQELQNLATPPALAVRGRLAGVDPSNDSQIIAFLAGPDPGNVLGTLRATPASQAAMRVFDAPASWQTHHHPEVAGPRVLTGDEANTDTIDPSAAAHWVITGVGGTGISAAEIILDNNAQARVTMIGGNATAGLFDNVQARRVMSLYGPTGDGRFQVVTGQEIGELRTPDGGATFDVGGRITAQDHLTAAPPNPAGLPNHRRWLVDANPLLLPAVRALLQRDVLAEAGHVGPAAYQRVLVTIVGAQVPDALRDDDEFEALLQEFGPVSGAIRLQVATGGNYGAVTPHGPNGVGTGELSVDGYISAIGRRGQSSPMITTLLASANTAGHAVAHALLWDDHGQYIGYRITITAAGQPARQVDVTGAASRFLPIPPFGVVDQNLVTQAGAFDAPPESGNFDGGFSASALQAQRYARQRRHDTEHAQLTTLHLDGAMGTLVLPQGEPKTAWEQHTKAFLVRELRVPADRIEVKCLASGASGDAVFRVTVGETQRIFKVFNDQYGQAQNELVQLQFLANLNLQSSQPVAFQQGQLPANVGGQAQRSGILMESAEGSSIEDMLGKLPPAGPMRAPAIRRIEDASRRVADALAELHSATEGPQLLTLVQKSGPGSAVASIRDVKLPGLQVELAPDYAAIHAAFLLAITGFENAAVPATAYHGDANAGNFILDEDHVRIIDVGAMRWSHDGAGPAGNSTGANDLARFTTSLETLRPGALAANEVAQIRAAFLQRYYQQCGVRNLAVNAGNMRDAIKIFKVETEIAVMRGAIAKLGPAPAAHLLTAARNAGRDRIKGVLGL